MKIQRHLKSIILASTLAFSCVAMPTAYSTDYKIVNVANWDSLNVRSGAGTGFDVVSEIPANSSNIKIVGDSRDVGGSTWVKIKWDGQSGWVNQRYLERTRTTNRNNSNNNNNNNMKQTYYNPQPTRTPQPTTNYRNYLPRDAGNNHTHPANNCTRSISHNHSGPAGHVHRYSCQNNGAQQQTTNYSTTDIYGQQRTTYTPRQNGNTHSHPANQCTRSISHNHAGPVNHSHRYSCQNKGGGRQHQVNRTSNRLQHTHGKSQCASAVSHLHKGGDTIHRHQCPSNGRSAQLGNRHTHQANSLTRATTHAHPFQDRRHSHHYGR
jgi:uncharacterized protein YraI